MNRRECLEEALKAVCFNRHTDYGDSIRCFDRIAALWSVIGLKRDGGPLTGEDVALAMILLKAARQSNVSKDDNWVDIAGYAALGAEYCKAKANAAASD